MSTFIRNSISIFALGLGLVASLPAWSQVDVSNAWIRGTAPGQTGTGAFMTLHAHRNAKLLSAKTAIAQSVEVHEMKMEGNTMRMKELQSLDLPAMQNVELKPGSYHIMLVGLKRDLTVGEQIPLKLLFISGHKTFKKVVKAEVRPLTAKAPEGQMDQPMHGDHHH